MDNSETHDSEVEAIWRSYLTTGQSGEGVFVPWYESPRMRAVVRHLPSDPRCHLCHYPFGGLGGALVRTFMRRQPSKLNPLMCNICEAFAEEHRGGAELEVSLMFADIRGSTPLAATMTAYDYSRLIDRFYQVTTNIIYDQGGLVDKLVGDEIVAFFVPAFSDGGNHALAAVKTGQQILAATGHGRAEAPWAPLGVGVHTGEAFVGAVGEPGKNIDITVLGDNVNIAARLTSQAAAGEMVISDAAARAGGIDTAGLPLRSLTLKGKEEPVEAWIYRA